MKPDSKVGVLFKMNNENYVTLVEARSRNKFRRLIGDWAPIDGGLIFNPRENQSFNYLPLEFVLNEIETTYKELQNSPAIQRFADKVFKMIYTIRIQNDEDIDDEDDND